jgi:hypothetical protein
MSDITYPETTVDQWDEGHDNTDEVAHTDKPSPTRRSKRSTARRAARNTVTRAQAKAVLDQLDLLSAASGAELEALATVLGTTAADARSLTIALASGTEPKHSSAMNDLLTIAASDEGDRDMVALTLGVGPSGMRRLRAAWDLACSLSGQTRSLSANPVQAARALANSANGLLDALSTIKTLLG